MSTIAVRRTQHGLRPDARRVLAKPFLPGEEVLLPGPSRTQDTLQRILAVPEVQVAALLAGKVRTRREERVGVVLSGGNTTAVDFGR